MKLAIVVPAFNEEGYLAQTLESIQNAAAQLRGRVSIDVDIVVVDNNSWDETAAIALEKGVRVIHEPIQGIGRARNAGARQAAGDVIVFIDADTIAPRNLLDAVCKAMSDPGCIGGAVDVDYRPQRLFIRLYLKAWRILARLTGMAQGATQFCRRGAFERVGGYDEKAWIGEDVDFFWSLKKFAKANKGRVQLIQSPRVQPSCRRFDKWPTWRILIWTNPIFIALFRRRKKVWGGWYSRPVR